MVRMLRELSLMLDSPAYSVVVLPDPVGPVTKMIPCGLANAARYPASTPSFMRSSLRFS